MATRDPWEARTTGDEARRLVRLFVAALFVGFAAMAVRHAFRRDAPPSAMQTGDSPAAAVASRPAITVVPWDVDTAWFDRHARDGTGSLEPATGARLLQRLRERAIANFVLDPRWSAHGGFPARDLRTLADSPKAFRTEPTAVEGELVAVDRRRLSSLFEEGAETPSGDGWIGRIVSGGVAASFIWCDDDGSRDLSSFVGARVRVLGVFHRIGAGADLPGPIVYAKVVVRAPPAVSDRWPSDVDLAALRRTPPEAPLDDDVYARAVVRGADPRRADEATAPADLAPADVVAHVGRPVRVAGRLVWTAVEPLLDPDGVPYAFPDPSQAARFASRKSIVLDRDGRFVLLAEAPSSMRKAGDSVDVDGRLLRAFHFANRGRDGVGVDSTPGYDPERDGVTTTLVVVPIRPRP